MSDSTDKMENKDPPDGQAMPSGSVGGSRVLDASSGVGNSRGGMRRSRLFVISDKAKEAARKNFQELQEAEKKKLDCHSSSLEHGPSSLDTRAAPEPPTVSFSTDSGRKVVVSDKALEAAKAKLIEDRYRLIEEGLEEVSKAKNVVSGFSTAGGRKITIAPGAVDAARAKLIDDDQDLAADTRKVVPGYFTGEKEGFYGEGESDLSESDLSESDLSTSGADRLRAAIVKARISQFGLSTAGGSKTAIADEPTKVSKPRHIYDKQEFATTRFLVPDFHSGRKSISSSAAKTLTDEIIHARKEQFRLSLGVSKPKHVYDKKDFIPRSTRYLFPDPHAGENEDLIGRGESVLSSGAEIFKYEIVKATNIQSGFSTAGGRKITVAHEALEAAKAKLIDDDFSLVDDTREGEEKDEGGEEVEGETTTFVSDFSTAGGRDILIARKAVEAARDKLTDPDVVADARKIVSGFSEDVSDVSRNDEKSRLSEENKDNVAEGRIESTMIGGVMLEVEEDPDKNSMVFEQHSEIHIVTTERGSSNEKEPIDIGDVSSEIHESTRILLEDIENSDDEWISSEDPVLQNIVNYPLASVKPGGEVIPSLKVTVTRVYPIMYCAVGKDGKNNFMTEKVFAKHQHETTKHQAALREQLLPGVEADIRSRLVKKEKINPKDLTPRSLRRMSADEILHIFNNLEDDAQTVTFVMGHLNLTMKKDVENAKSELLEKIRRAVEEELEEKVKAALPVGKHPSRVLKIRVMDVASFQNQVASTNGIITIWNPQEEAIANIEEGKVYDFQALKPGTFHDGQEIRLGTTKTTRICPVADILPESAFKRKLSGFDEVLAEGFAPPFGEFDTVGIVKKVEDFKEHVGQIVHLVEENGNVLKIKFWTSLVDSDLQDVFKTGSIVGCLNLQWRITSVETKMAFTHEFTTFHVTPKVEHLQKGFKQLNAAMKETMPFLGTEVQSTGGSVSKASPLPEENVESSGVATRNSAKRRYLDRFEEPPELPTLSVASPSKRGRVSKKFVTPRRVIPKK